MVSGDDLKTMLESETGLHWTVADDKPSLKRFVAISFEYRLEYSQDRDGWTFIFDDQSTPEEPSKLGLIDTDSVSSEFRGFVQETYPEM